MSGARPGLVAVVLVKLGVDRMGGRVVGDERDEREETPWPISWNVLSRVAPENIRTYNQYMPNKTISVPDDVIPVIESLDVPFSRWVTDQLRRHAAKSTMSFADQILADAALAAGDRVPDRDTVGERMERSAPW